MTNQNQEIYILRSGQVGVLLLHSFTGTPSEFSSLSVYLANKGLTVYAPLLAGHGTSPDQLAETSIEDWQKSVVEAYFTLSQKVQKVYLVGSSFGANLALWLATKFPHAVKGIISLGAPIKVRRHKLYQFLLYTYGYFIKHQKKIFGDYKVMSATDRNLFYQAMPVKSLRQFFWFIRAMTIPNLKRVLTPTLIIQSITDRTVNPLSAQYLYDHLGSRQKDLLWVNGSNHILAFDKKRDLIFYKIYRFVSGS